ncbi:MAG: 30S ribosomal protein S8e [Thermoproteus sp.]
MKSMAFYQGNDLRKPTGGTKRRVAKVKQKALCGGPARVPSIGPQEVEVERVTGGNIKVRLRSVQYANVYIPKEKKSVKAKIISVVSTPSNPDFAKKGQVVKGAVIQTEVGRAVVTSRPGQDGVVNAVLVG